MDVRCPQCARLVAADTGQCQRCGAALTVPLRLNWVARLFWACPSCRAEEPLTLNQPLFGEPSLGCRICRTSWLLNATKRELVQLDPATKAVAVRHSIEEWLAELPAATDWRPLPVPQLLLFPGETCYLRSERTRLLDPRPGLRERQQFGRIEIFPGIFERIVADPYGPSPSKLGPVARGPLFATDRRLVFLGDRKHVEIPLARLDGVEVDEGFLVVHRAARIDTFGFDDASAVRVRDAILRLSRGELAASDASAERDAAHVSSVA